MKSRTTITVVGAAGRMGREVISRGLEMADVSIVSLWESPSSPVSGRLEPSTGLAYQTPWSEPMGDVIVDFTNREGLLALLEGAPETGFALVSGTTGLTDDEFGLLRALSRGVPVFHSSNMSIGIHILHGLVREAVSKVGPSWDVELVEMHHKNKADAPSGTALALARTASEAAGGLEIVTGRGGMTGRRSGREIGVMALRGGEVVGEHELILAGPGELLRLKHTALSRSVFAAGALEAARWLAGRGPGLYCMADMLAPGGQGQ